MGDSDQIPKSFSCARERPGKSSQNSLPYRPFQLNLKKAPPRHMFSLLLPASGITYHPKDRPLDRLPSFQALFSPAHPLCCQFSLSTNAAVSSLSYVFQCHHSTCRCTSLALTSPRSCHNAAQATPPPLFPEDALSSLNTSAPPSPSWPTLLPDILFIFQRLDSDRMPLCYHTLNTSPQQINCSSSMSSQFLFCAFLLGLSF